MIFYSIFFTVTVLMSELTLRLSAFGNPFGFNILLIVFSVIWALFFAVVSSLFKGRYGKIVSYILTIAIALFYGINIVYQHIFTGFLSVSQLGMGGDALTSFWKETLIGIFECLPYIAIILLPLAALIFFDKKQLFQNRKGLDIRHAVMCICMVVLLHCGTEICIDASSDESYGVRDLYNDTFVLALSQKKFGALTSTRLEIRGMFFKKGTGSIVEEKIETDEASTDEASSDQKIPADASSAESAAETPAAVQFAANVMDISFLVDGETDADKKALNEYFRDKAPTLQNEMTGKLAGYNVITLVCESFSPYLVDKDRTPALYRMSAEGIVFDEYYNTVCDNTSNSEYALITGLLPDGSLLGKGWDTFYEFNSCTASQKNYLPLTLGNISKANGVKSLAFHNYYGNYYGRNKTHPNFGYDFYYMLHDLKKTSDWPTSDLSMMEQSLDKLLTPDDEGNIERFNAYFLTFSGHMSYNFDSNNMAAKNKSVSDGLEYDTAVRAYISCNQELEYAVEYLIDKLDEAGVLDNTLIVLLQDHYPYNMGLKKLSQLAGKNLVENEFESEFNQFRGALYMWSPSIETMHVTDPVCELDVLPTLLNLLGYEYDSRLLMGRDVFSDSEPLAVLGDRSFVTKDYYYNANTAEVTAKSAEYTPPKHIVDRMVTMIKNKFTVSNLMLYTDYYSYIFGAQQSKQ